MKEKRQSRTDTDAGTRRTTSKKSEKSIKSMDSQVLMDLSRRAEKGDAQAMSELRKTLLHNDIWDCLANMVAFTEEAQIKLITGDNQDFAGSIKRQVAKLKAELGGHTCTPIERLIVDRIAVCWLQANYADTIYAQNMKGLSIRWGDYFQRQQDRANRRLLSALRSLASVRKLPLAVLQVNIDKQVNIAGCAAAPELEGSTARVVSATEVDHDTEEKSTATQNILIEEDQS